MSTRTICYYGAALAGALTITTFAYTVVLVPAGKWIGTIPGAVSSATSGMFTSNSAKISAPRTQQTNSVSVATPVHVAQEKTPKPANCDRIVKQINAGKYVELPEECRTAYEISLQRKQESERARQEAEQQKAAERQREYEKERGEQQHRQQLETAQQREAERQHEMERRQQEAEQTRAANLERDRQRQQAEDRRRQEEREESDRRQARRDAEQREQNRQREAQKRNDAIIKFGTDLKRVFKKN